MFLAGYGTIKNLIQSHLIFIYDNIYFTFYYSEVLYELSVVNIHKLHLLHHHRQVPDIHVQSHIQQHVLLSQCVGQVEE